MDDNKRLIFKIAAALNPGGLAVISENIRTEPPDAFNSFFSLVMLSNSGTRTYRYDEITGWLSDAGLGSFHRVDLPPNGQSSIITAVNPD